MINTYTLSNGVTCSKDESDDATDTVDVNLVIDDDKQSYAHKKGDLL